MVRCCCETRTCELKEREKQGTPRRRPGRRWIRLADLSGLAGSLGLWLVVRLVGLVWWFSLDCFAFIQSSSVQFGSVRFSSVQFSLVLFGSVWFCLVCLVFLVCGLV